MRSKSTTQCSVPSGQTTRSKVRSPYLCERVPHVTLKSIANNTEIDVNWGAWQQKLEPLREALDAALTTQAP